MSYFIEFTVISAVLGTFVVLLIAPFAMVAVVVLLLGVVAAALALVAGIVAAPFLAVRALRNRHSGRQRHVHTDDHVYAAARASAARASIGSAS